MLADCNCCDKTWAENMKKVLLMMMLKVQGALLNDDVITALLNDDDVNYCTFK